MLADSRVGTAPSETEANPEVGPAGEAVRGRSLWRDAMSRFMRNRAALLSVIVLVLESVVVIAVAMLIGLAMNFAGLNAVKMLFWSAVLNGVLAPPLVVLVVLLSSDPKVMGDRINSRTARMLGWLCAAVMTAAAIALLLT